MAKHHRELKSCRESREKSGISFDQMKAAAQRTADAHNAEETPLFAKDVERKAVQGIRLG
jgi:hypothetical protein